MSGQISKDIDSIINHPKMRWAQHLADKNRVSYCLVENAFGDYDIKKSSDVSPYVNNPRLVAEILPATIERREARKRRAEVF